jgi:hypothetical protein
MHAVVLQGTGHDAGGRARSSQVDRRAIVAWSSYLQTACVGVALSGRQATRVYRTASGYVPVCMYVCTSIHARGDRDTAERQSTIWTISMAKNVGLHGAEQEASNGVAHPAATPSTRA